MQSVIQQCICWCLSADHSWKHILVLCSSRQTLPFMSVRSDLTELWFWKKGYNLLRKWCQSVLKCFKDLHELCVTTTAADPLADPDCEPSNQQPNHNNQPPVVFESPAYTCPFHLPQCLVSLTHRSSSVLPWKLKTCVQVSRSLLMVVRTSN